MVGRRYSLFLGKSEYLGIIKTEHLWENSNEDWLKGKVQVYFSADNPCIVKKISCPPQNLFHGFFSFQFRVQSWLVVVVIIGFSTLLEMVIIGSAFSTSNSNSFHLEILICNWIHI